MKQKTINSEQVYELTVVDSSFAGSSWFCCSVFPLESTDFLDSPDAAMNHYLPMRSVGPEPGLYIILSQPVIGWRSLLRSSCRLFDLSPPIQLIRPPCVYSISLIRRKSRLFCSQPVTWKMRNKVLKQSAYLCLFFTHPSSMSWLLTRTPLLFSHVDCDDFTARCLILSRAFMPPVTFPLLQKPCPAGFPARV